MDALKHIFLKNGSGIFEPSTEIFDAPETPRENRALVPPSRLRTHGALLHNYGPLSGKPVEFRIECTVTVILSPYYQHRKRNTETEFGPDHGAAFSNHVSSKALRRSASRGQSSLQSMGAVAKTPLAGMPDNSISQPG